MKKFFQRKSKSKAKSTANSSLVPNNDGSNVSLAPSKASSAALSKSTSHLSKLSKSSKSINSKTSHDQPVEPTDTRQDCTSNPTSQDESRCQDNNDDIFFIRTITTSSADTDEDEVSHLSFDHGTEQPDIVEKTTMVKQYVVDHLLGCVDFIEDCAVGIKDGGNGGDTATANETVDGTVGKETKDMSRTTCMDVNSPASTARELERKPTLANLECSQRILCADQSLLFASASQDDSVVVQATLSSERQIETSTAAPLPSPSKYYQEIPKSKYLNIQRSTKNALDSSILSSNKDYLLAMTNIDAIIDSQVARMCDEMCICGDHMLLCGGDDVDELSQFQDLMPISEDCENMLFQ
jgi:hypothetical protein